MKVFPNNRSVTMDDLKKHNDIYPTDLLENLNNKYFEKLNDLPIKLRSDKEYMEPLLFAIKKEFKTYIVYTFYADSLKNDPKLASEIIQDEPNLIKGTPITRNEQFFLDNAEAKPQIIQYMSPELMKKDKLIVELINKNNPDILKEVTKNCDISVAIMNNPELSNNELFMTVLIKEDVTKIEYISNKLRNNYEFIKNICNNNKETINYISEHTDSFGEKGLTAAKEVLVEKTTSKAISEFESELQLINKMESENKDQSEEEKKKIAIRERQLKNNMKFIQRIKEGKVDQERAIRLINSICKNLDEDYKKELMKYIKMDDALLERQDDKKNDIKSMEANTTTLNKNENNVYANMNEGENKLSITQKIAKFFEKHESLMNISIIKNFVRKQLDVLSPASNQEENNKDISYEGDNDRNGFIKKISYNGNSQNLELQEKSLVPGKTPENTEEKEFYE